MSPNPNRTMGLWILLLWAITLLLYALIMLSGCVTLQQAPRHIQYGAYTKVSPPGFYGVDSDTKEHHYKSFDDKSMNGSQCLSPSDYKAMAAWVDYLTQEAEKRCQ